MLAVRFSCSPPPLSEAFAGYLTADNATAFCGLAGGTRTELMKRFVLLDDPGRPLLSNDAQGHTVLRCQTPSVIAEMRLGETRLWENLAFVPVEIVGAKRVDIGLVRERGAGVWLCAKIELKWEIPANKIRKADSLRVSGRQGLTLLDLTASGIIKS